MSRRLLITGGAGFIGSTLLKQLAPSDKVLVVDNLHPQVHSVDHWSADSPARVEFLQGDITDPDVVDRAARFKPHTLVHLAAETGTGQSLLQSSRHASVNVNGTATLLDAISGSGWMPDRMILTSSRAVYGEGKWQHLDGSTYYAPPRRVEHLASARWEPVDKNGAAGTPLPQDARTVEPRPSNIYAATKLAQEHLMSAWCSALGVDLCILRLQNVYGPGQSVKNSYTGVLTYFARQAIANEQIRVFEGGNIIRDFVHVSDVARTIRNAIDARGSLEDRFDVGSGRSTTLLDVARQIAEIAGAPEPHVTNEYRLGDVRAASADVTRARDVLGHSSSVTLVAGLSQVLDWVEKELP
ncbi:NAD-dependent epimerase/dehydratase family protein [Nocardioides solisilvae]|uniref:NAD-dependent epimerase/dehydratase family protein n=1 Tax=Nocardioides solisilvae TaxID=1542435 RepID=UPI000D749E6B|nr:NAD-dependent epimerase/dehydratase family protein [Nocardioides solisilvae]